MHIEQDAVLSQGGPHDAALRIEVYSGIARFFCHSTAFLYGAVQMLKLYKVRWFSRTAVTRNHGDSRKSQHTTGKSHDDRYYGRYR